MKGSSRRLVLSLAAAGVAATASTSLATAASAQPIRESEVFEETQEFEDFCDASGLTVQVNSTTESRFMFNPHGPDGLGHGLEHLRITNVYANAANGNAVTEQITTVFKDLRVTDNGDGTVTILVLATGNAVVRGPDGKAIARNPGQIRFEALVDNGGTPTDPSDDEFLDVLRDVKGSTGRTDDFCEAVVPVLSG
jgi:hypothetical protein